MTLAVRWDECLAGRHIQRSLTSNFSLTWRHTVNQLLHAHQSIPKSHNIMSSAGTALKIEGSSALEKCKNN